MPSDGAALYAAYIKIDAALVAKGAPATSKRWLRALRSFWASGKLRMVVRKGRQVGASTIIAPRVIAATALAGEFTRSRGTRRTIGLSSSRQKEADERIHNIGSNLDDLGIRTKVRGDTLEVLNRSLLIQSFPSTAEVARGTNALMWWEDEMPVWRDGDGANPAGERDAAIVPAGATHENFRIYSIGTPMGDDDYHARLIDLGDTDHQSVFVGPSWYWNPTLTEARCRQLQPDKRMFDREFGAIPQAGLLSALDFDLVNASFGRTDAIAVAGPPSMIIDGSSGRGDWFTWAIAQWCRTTTDREVLIFSLVDGIGGKFANTMTGDAIVTRLAAVCREHGVTQVHGDQRESLMLRARSRSAASPTESTTGRSQRRSTRWLAFVDGSRTAS